MNFVVCPYDATNLKVGQPRADPAWPPLMRCPTCGKHFRLVHGEAVEADANGRT
jgi:uncharacterized protein YbaR (Trm112 family)